MAVGDVYIGEVSVGEVPVGDESIGEMSFGELSGHPKYDVVIRKSTTATLIVTLKQRVFIQNTAFDGYFHVRIVSY